MIMTSTLSLSVPRAALNKLKMKPFLENLARKRKLSTSGPKCDLVRRIHKSWLTWEQVTDEALEEIAQEYGVSKVGSEESEEQAKASIVTAIIQKIRDDAGSAVESSGTRAISTAASQDTLASNQMASSNAQTSGVSYNGDQPMTDAFDPPAQRGAKRRRVE